jgi:hypothetical protein
MRRAAVSIVAGVTTACSLFIDYPSYDRESTAPVGDERAPGEGGTCGDTQSDAKNCGACGHDCLGTACSLGLCGPELVAGPSALSVAAAYVVNGIAVDATHVYAVGPSGDANNGYVTRIDKTTRFVEPLATGCDRALRVVTVGDALFWTQNTATSSTRGIGTAKKTAPGAATVWVANQLQPFLLATDGSALFWVASYGATGDIWRAGTTTAGAAKIVPNAQAESVTADESRVYWTSSSQGTVRSASKDGSDVRSVAEGQATPAGITFDATHVYWSNNGAAGGGIFRAPKNGGRRETVAETAGGNLLVLVDDAFAYFNRSSEIFRVPKGGGEPLRIAATSTGIVDLALDARHVYWVDKTQIARVAK